MAGTAVTLEQVLEGLTREGQYLGPNQFTFSIPTTGSGWSGYASGSEPFTGYSVFNAGQAANFRKALAAWDAFIAPDFTEVTEPGGVGEIRVAFTTISDAAGYAFLAQPRSTTGSKVGDIWIANDYVADSFDSGTYNFEVLLHELGHALGLSHSFDNTAIPKAFENRTYTIMSYTDDADGIAVEFYRNGSSLVASPDYVVQTTPMVLDIAAIQSLYGAETTTALGDTVYRFDQAATNRQAIYDAGGNDTIDTSNFTRASEIDLNPGAYSSLGIWTRVEQVAFWQAQFPGYGQFIPNQLARSDLYEHRDNLGIAFATTIENAIGGSAADTLAGNASANRLDGRGGNDTLRGQAGDDSLLGGLGADFIAGGDGIDTVSYADNWGAVFVNLTLRRGWNNAAEGDTYDSVENVVGSTYADFVIGDDGVNRIDGRLGNDVLIGSLGGDVLVGSDGADIASYQDNQGTVFINLTLARGFNNAAEGDTYDGIEHLVGGVFDDWFIGDEGGNRLDGAMGADTLTGAGGADTFILSYAPGATSEFGSANVDTILDFTSGTDRIELAAGAFTGLATGALAAGAFVAGTAATEADDRILYDAATGRLYFDADGTGSAAAQLFAVLDNRPATLAAVDFVIA